MCIVAEQTYHSIWECPKCGRVQRSPILGTISVSHGCTKHTAGKTVGVAFKRTWRSKYDKMKG